MGADVETGGGGGGAGQVRRGSSMKLSYGNIASCLNLNKLGQNLGEHVDKLH